jgi:hypothetical protein
MDHNKPFFFFFSIVSHSIDYFVAGWEEQH